MTNHHVSNDDQLSEEQMAFPYLLNLDKDTELLSDETGEEPTSEKEFEKHPTEPMETRVSHTTLGITKLTRSNSAPNLTTSNPIFATTPFTTNTPITAKARTEVPHPTNETLNLLQYKLADAGGKITDLLHRADRSEARALQSEARMLTMENTIRQLMLLHPTLQNTNPNAENLTSPKAQPAVPSKRPLGEGSNSNPPQPRTKRTKTSKTVAVEPEERGYKGKKPLCPQCKRHHKGPCGPYCSNCKKHGHLTKDCRSAANNNNNNPKPDAGQPRVCHGCGSRGHFIRDCPNPNNNA